MHAPKQNQAGEVVVWHEEGVSKVQRSSLQDPNPGLEENDVEVGVNRGPRTVNRSATVRETDESVLTQSSSRARFCAGGGGVGNGSPLHSDLDAASGLRLARVDGFPSWYLHRQAHVHLTVRLSSAVWVLPLPPFSFVFFAVDVIV
jgi:hypothetical protein